jgi:hypothetical protein
MPFLAFESGFHPERPILEREITPEHWDIRMVRFHLPISADGRFATYAHSIISTHLANWNLGLSTRHDPFILTTFTQTTQPCSQKQELKTQQPHAWGKRWWTKASLSPADSWWERLKWYDHLVSIVDFRQLHGPITSRLECGSELFHIQWSLENVIFHAVGEIRLSLPAAIDCDRRETHPLIQGNRSLTSFKHGVKPDATEWII